MLTNKIKTSIICNNKSSKIKNMLKKKEKGIEVLTIKDLGINLKPEKCNRKCIYKSKSLL